MTLGATIRALREARGWSQGQLAVHSEVQQSHLSKIERDVHETINARVLGRIARALQVSSDYLMEEAGWLPKTANPGELNPGERRLLDAIRSIPTDHIQMKVVEQFTWIAEVAAAADEARQPPSLRLVAEENEDYEAKEE